MNKINILSILLLVLIAVTSIGTAIADPQLAINLPSQTLYITQPVTILVTDRETGNAVVGANVKECMSQTIICNIYTTDLRGNIRFTPYSTDYQIWAMAPGYLNAYTTMTVANPQYIINTNINNGYIKMQIVDQNNNPIVGAIVRTGFLYWWRSYPTDSKG